MGVIYENAIQYVGEIIMRLAEFRRLDENKNERKRSYHKDKKAKEAHLKVGFILSESNHVKEE